MPKLGGDEQNELVLVLEQEEAVVCVPWLYHHSKSAALPDISCLRSNTR